MQMRLRYGSLVKGKHCSATAIWNPLVPKQTNFPFKAFFSIGFSHHRTILAKVKDVKERIFYVIRCSEEKYSREELTRSIERDDYHHLGFFTWRCGITRCAIILLGRGF